jgi:hypothetical protein
VFIKSTIGTVCLYTSLMTLLYSYLFLLLSFTRECINLIHDRRGVFKEDNAALFVVYTSLT